MNINIGNKRFFCVLLYSWVVCGFVIAHSSDYNEDWNENWTVDVFIRTWVLSLDSKGRAAVAAAGLSTAEAQAAAVVSGLSLATGLGYGFEIIPDLFMPGLYFDFSFSPFVFLIEEEDPNDAKYWPLFHFGLRVYNQFKIAWFDIEPFYGFNLAVGKEDTVSAGLYQVFGLLLAFKKISVEYAYCFPFRADVDWKSINGGMFHRISIGIHGR